jgi:hypothetical protein
MEDSHPESPQWEALEAHHHQLQLHDRALGQVYTQQAMAERGVGKTSSLKRPYLNIMSLLRDTWRRHLETRREIHDQIEHETSYYDYPLFNSKSSVPTFSMSF